MGTLRLTYTVADTVQLDRALNRIAIQVDDFTRPLEQSSDIIYAETKHQFETEGSPDWEPLSEAYARRKARKFPGQPILRATNRLMQSLINAGAEGAIHTLTKTLLVIGSSLQVGKWNLGLIHQKGAPRASIPAREMLRLRPSARTRIILAFRDHLVAVAAAQGVEVQRA
jgi:phage gpG-like protein